MRKNCLALFRNAYLVLAWLSLFGFLSAILFPYLYGLWHSGWITFTNAYDEETYLSFQGAAACANLPGYFIEKGVYWLHLLGLSGGAQNLLFDLLVPITVIGVATWLLVRIGVSFRRAFLAGMLIAFGSVLLNKANPLISLLAHRVNFAWMSYPGENYPSLLRTPNPQLSYFLIAAFTFLAVRRNIWFAAAPLPLLYWPIMAPWFIIVGTYFIFSRYSLRSWRQILLANALVSLVTALLLVASIFFIKTFFSGETAAAQFSTFRSPAFPALSILGWLSYAAAYHKIQQRKEADRHLLHFIFITLNYSVLFNANIPLIVGARLSPEGFNDYWANFAILALMALTLSCFSEDAFGVKDAILLGLVMVSLYFCLKVYGVDFAALRIRVPVMYVDSQEERERVLRDPTHALYLCRDCAGHMTLIAPAILAPPLSYQYKFPFFYNDCVLNQSMRDGAIKFVKAEIKKGGIGPAAQDEFERMHKESLYYDLGSNNFRINNRYCDSRRYPPGDYFVVKSLRGPTETFP